MTHDLPATPPFVRSPRPRRVLIIGGGVAGIATLNALTTENGVPSSSSAPIDGGERESAFDHVELIERRDNIGGVWYLNEETVKLERSFPGGTANEQWPIHRPDARQDARPFWPSPAYPALRGNVLPPFLTFTGDKPFPPPASSEEAFRNRVAADHSNSKGASEADVSLQPFDPYPTLTETQSYLERVAEPLRQHIRCNVECIGVWELPRADDASQNQWAVRVRDWNDGAKEKTEYWDAVVLSVGWTDTPVYPQVEGLTEARKAGLADHCKWYRGPEPYGVNKRIAVVGNSISGNDVCVHLAALRTEGEHEPVYRICRHKAFNFAVHLPDPLVRDVPALKRVQVSNNKLNLHLIDGQVLENVDHLIIATGYEIAQFPFVRFLDRSLDAAELQTLSSLPASASAAEWQPDPKLNTSLWRSISSAPRGTTFEESRNPQRVSGLFWDFLHERASTFAIVNLPVSSVPFWLSSVQGHCLRAIWDGSYSLPSALEDRREYEKDRLQVIESLNRQKEDNERTAKERHRQRLLELQGEQGQNGAENGLPNGQGRESKDRPGQPPPSYEAPDHIPIVRHYHIIGTQVADYLIKLRSIAIEGKPHWSDKLADFENVHSLYTSMYDIKRHTLQTKREAGTLDRNRKQNDTLPE